MCGRYSQTKTLKELTERFQCQSTQQVLLARYNIAPMQDALVVTNEGSRVLKLMQWGLVPSWAKEAAIGNKMINARAETLLQKPSFRKSFLRRRCLVPADGFYEWSKANGSNAKIPMRIVLKSQEPFAFAGLWDIWKKPDGSELQSFTIITTEPNELLRPIHNRMPAILQRHDEEMWLDPNFSHTSSLTKLFLPYPSNKMDVYEISGVVNSPKNDGPECVRAVKG